MMPRALIFVIALFGLWLLASADARAQTCTASVSAITFTGADVLPGTEIYTTGTMSISCSSIPLTGVRVCAYLGNGSGGRDATSRIMQGTSSTLRYELYTDSGRSTVWGDPNLGFGSSMGVDFTGNLAATATGSTTFTIYAKLLMNQKTAIPGSYTSNFTTADTRVTYGLNVLGLLPCNSLPALNTTLTPTFTVSAGVVTNCYLTTGNINFGSHGVISSPVTANGSLTLQCSNTAPYSVALGNGLNGTAPDARKMKLGANTITYALYQDSGYGTLWGDSGLGLLNGTGSGNNQILTVYGRVPVPPKGPPPPGTPTYPPPGTYHDTIQVTVTY